MSGEKDIIIPRIDIARDLTTIAAQAANTDEADIVLDDIISTLEAACSFRNLKTATKRTYASSIVVEFENDIAQSIRVFDEIQKIISPAIKAAAGVSNQEIQFQRLMFTFDPTLLPASKSQNTAFLIERRAGQSFSENRFFCGAPLKTEDHLKVLEKVGKLLDKKT